MRPHSDDPYDLVALELNYDQWLDVRAALGVAHLEISENKGDYCDEYWTLMEHIPDLWDKVNSVMDEFE